MAIEGSHPAVEAIAAALQQAPAPLTLKNLEKTVRAHASALPEAVAAGAAFSWPRYRNSARYWHREPAAFVRQQILGIAATNAMPKKDLVRATNRSAHNCGAKTAEAAIAALVKEGALKTVKAVSSSPLYYNPANPEALVSAALGALVESLRKQHAGDDVLQILPREPLASAAFTVPPPQPAGPLAPVPSPAAPPATVPLPERLLDAIRRLQPAPAVPVAVAGLRAALADVSKPDFDSAVLSLADGQRVYLTTHDHGWALPEPERDRLVWDGGQKLYVAVTLRD